jgi:tetratricopeptide (TPR) repeat protein
MGRHFQLIGIIYEQQQNWDKALENYEQALVWKQRSGNDYELGHTYYQIDSVYTKRGEYSQSLDFLTRAYNNFLLYDHSHLPLAETALARIREKLAEAEHPNPDTNS